MVSFTYISNEKLNISRTKCKRYGKSMSISNVYILFSSELISSLRMLLYVKDAEVYHFFYATNIYNYEYYLQNKWLFCIGVYKHEAKPSVYTVYPDAERTRIL